MRRDAYIQNDSGGFSILSGGAVDDIIADGRADDLRFVRAHQALLIELVGDDSLPVRVVVDEPLLDDEQREWLACSHGRLNASDGRVLVMGGFDPDILEDWRDEHAPADDGTGVAVVRVEPGIYDVDIYTYASSLNGNALLKRGPLPVGEWFRRDHAGSPFPLWLARILDYGGSEDPGHESEWRDAAASLRHGVLDIDTTNRGFIGLLFHLQSRRGDMPQPELPESGWFSFDAGARSVEQCPLGIVAEVEDRNLVSLAKRLTGTREREDAEEIVWGPRFDVRRQWETAPSTLAGGPVAIGLSRAWLAWAIPALCSDSVPRVEVRVSNAPGWKAEARTPLCAEDADGDQVVGVPSNLSGWMLWSALAELGDALSGVPDGARVELLTGLESVDADIPDVGMLRLAGKVRGGRWLIDAASPPTSAAHLSDALDFTTNLLELQRLLTHTDSERAALEIAFAEWGGFIDEDAITREGDVCTFHDADLRDKVLLAQPVFRTRFAGLWAMDGADDDNDDD